MKKITPVFGPQELFDGAPECATHATKGGGFYAINNGVAEYVSDGMFNGIEVCTIGGYLIAERRIEEVPEPKRWTLADQKAGLLPDVGAKYGVECCIVEHLGNGSAGYENIFYFKYPSGACGNAHMRSAKPLETPEDKAARLRSDWIDMAYKLNVSAYRDDIGDVYDALLSGKLPPVQAKDAEQ